MTETIIERDQRFVTIKRYCEMSGLSYATVNHLLKTGHLSYITTESGLRRVDTQPRSPGQNVLLEKLERNEKMLSALCAQFNVRL